MEKNKLTILVDMDDVLEVFAVPWVKEINRRFNRNVDPNDITTWEIRDHFPGITDLQMEKILDEPEFWEKIKPVDGAVETVKRLIDDGHKIYVVTSSYYTTLVNKMEKVLFKYFPYITWDMVIVAHDKWKIKGDVIIDDGEHNLINYSSKSTRILFTTTFNRGFNAQKYGILRANTWDDVYKIINKKIYTSNKNDDVDCTEICEIYDRFCYRCKDVCPHRIKVY